MISIEKAGNELEIIYENQVVITGISIYNSETCIPLTFAVKTPAGYSLQTKDQTISVDCKLSKTTASFSLNTNGIQSDEWKLMFDRFFFDEMVHFYKYNHPTTGEEWAWTIPLKIKDQKDFCDNRVNFSYWKLGTIFGAAIPLSGRGYRGTLGRTCHKIGSLSYSGIQGMDSPMIPLLTIGFGPKFYDLTKCLVYESLAQMGKLENLVSKKELPKVWHSLGWCSWNSSNEGKDLNSQWLKKQVEVVTRNQKFGWVLIDDGWMKSEITNHGRTLSSFLPDPNLFPNGFRDLKETLCIENIGVWHTINGYWDGITANSELGSRFKKSLYKYNDFHFWIKPNQMFLEEFYEEWYKALSEQGISFTKVDNQFIGERLGGGIYPVFNIGESCHSALNYASNSYMGNQLMNCMDQTQENYWNFGNSPLSRVSEDYFPTGEGYNLLHGNAAAHLTQCVYNSIFWKELIYPDFDMFETYHPSANLHAVARTLNSGPIYITDRAGETNYELLKKICYSDGRTIRADTALVPAEDSIFNVQDCTVTKLLSTSNNIGLLLAVNFADCDKVSGKFKPNELMGFRKYLVYNYISQEVKIMDPSDSENITLGRLDWQLYFLAEYADVVAFGNVEKFNSPATISTVHRFGDQYEVGIQEGGNITIFSEKPPVKVWVDGIQVQAQYRNKLINLVTMLKPAGIVNVKISFEKEWFEKEIEIIEEPSCFC